MTEKSARNHTLATSLEEGANYLERCVSVESPQSDIRPFWNRTILGDTFAVCPLLPENSVDLIIADPPYNLTKSYDGTVFSKKKAAEYETYTRDWLARVYPLLKESGSIYVCCDWETSLVIGPVLAETFRIRNRITWQREKGRGASANWKNGMEDIWFATKGKNYIFNLGAVRIRRKVVAPYRVAGQPKDWDETEAGNYRDTCPSNFWDDITIPFWSMPENTEHPTQKSEKLVAKIILASSNPGDLVFDPFLGSGTTSVTAKKLGRRYLGVEIEPRYCVWCEQRLEMAEENPAVQGYLDGVFWERNSGTEQKLHKTAKRRQKEPENESV